MRSLTTSFALVILMVSGLMVSGPLARAQGSPSDGKAAAAPSNVASKEEVNELRGEVAAQRKTIEELKALVEKLVNGKTQAAVDGTPQIHPVADAPSAAISALPVSASRDGVRLTNAVLVQPDPVAIAAVVDQAAPAAAPKKEPPLTAGWNGEHFFIRSPDGQFSISPYGYVDNDYRAYKGDGAPSDTFVLRRARFGFQGNYGSHFDFALLTDAASTSGSVVRDVYPV
ncbi:MAG: hypothetical protein WBC78_12240, partial [Candidatus Sulfotelmatobacter sp.]